MNGNVKMKKKENDKIHQLKYVGREEMIDKNKTKCITIAKKNKTKGNPGIFFSTLISFLFTSRNFPSSVKVMISKFWTIIGIIITRNTIRKANVEMFPAMPAQEVKTDNARAKYMFKRLILTFCLLLDFCFIFLPCNYFGFFRFNLPQNWCLSKWFVKTYVIIVLFLSINNSAFAFISNQRIADNVMASDIAKLVHYTETKYKIPKGLLASIAKIESNNQPFAINIGGESYFAADIESAKEYIVSKLSVGITNIDIGIMQINWRWHGKAFKNLYHILLPKYNIEYAGRLLASLKKQHGDWHTAVRLYHSAKPEYYRIYSRKVVMNWVKSG